MIIDKENFLKQYFEEIRKTKQFSDHGSSIEEFIDDYDYDDIWFDPSDPSLLDNEDFWEGFKNWLPKRFDYALKQINQDIGFSNTIPLVRAMIVQDGKIIEEGSSVGIFWTIDNGGYNITPYQGNESSGVEIHLRTSVSKNQINVYETMKSRMDYAHGDQEGEIQLLPNQKIQITSVVYRNGKKYEYIKNGYYYTTKKLNEDLNTSYLEFKESSRGYYSGQADLTISAYLDDEMIGYIDYSVFQNVPSIQFIEVREDYRRRGIARQLVLKLQSIFPDTEIEWGMMTGDGAALYDMLTFKEIPIFNIKKYEKLKEKLKNMYQSLIERMDRGEEVHPSEWDKYYAMEDSLERIEQSEQFIKRTKKIIVA